MRRRGVWALAGAVVAVGIVAALPLLKSSAARTYGYEVVARLPHDPEAYTQGLLYHDGHLYESTGLYGESSLRRLVLPSARTERSLSLPQRYFGEGVALVRGVLVQLTWKAGTAFVYNSDSFEPIGTFSYDTEGWGLTFDGRSLIMSDGSERLYFREPGTFRLEKTLTVTDAGRPIRDLNELEFIDGEVWANVYQTFDVVRIDRDTGEVLGRIDFRGILRPEDRNGREDALNGIAYDAQNERLFVTGKRYSYIYEVRVREAD